MRPFVGPVAWATILAVAVHPLYARLRTALGGRAKSAAALIVVLGLVILFVPIAMLGGTALGGAQALARGLKEGRIAIPALPPGVAEWPVIGEQIVAFWSNASQNLEATFRALEPHLIDFGAWLLSAAAGTGITVVLSVLAIVIAGVVLANDAVGRRAALAIGERLTGRGAEFVDLVGATVQSVAQGILGVALIQSFLAGVGFLAVGVPGAGLWALIGLLLCVVQLGLFLILVPILIWVYSAVDTVPAVLFTIWSVVVGLLDNVLKPMLLGRGVKAPTVVIFLGAIGGFLSSGIIGLFVGSVVLVVGYTLFMAWVDIPPEPVEAEDG
jgi:predicted PurR-regulated permease PerM